MAIRIGNAAKDILARLEQNKLKAVGKPLPPTVAWFFSLWVSQLQSKYANMGCIAPFTNRHKHHVKQLIELWGHDCTEAILTLIIARWIQFTKSVEEDTTAFNSPMMPSIEYLYKYRAEAKNYWIPRKDMLVELQTTSNKLIVKSNAAAQEAQLTNNTNFQLIPPEPAEEPATLDDLMAMMSVLNDSK
jgi:hypothetical protein